MLVVAVIALASPVAAGCRNAGVITNSYATLTEAQAAGAVTRGWLPAMVPAGAHDIREAHDGRDSRRRWGIFSFRPEDADQLRSRLGSERSFAGLGADAPARIEWWPLQLRGDMNAERLAGTGLKAYEVTGENLVAAVNWNQRRAYYWSPR